MKIKLPLLLLAVAMSFHCNFKNPIPAGVPTEAKFEKRTGLFSHTQDKIQRKWVESGEIYSECRVTEQGVLDGICMTFRDKGSIVLSHGRYKNGQRDGEWRWYFSDGKLYYYQEFAYGKKKDFWLQTEIWGNEHGKYKRYYHAGQLEEEGMFDSGMKTGNWVKFFHTGQKEYSGKYSADKKIGIWEHYFPSGILEAVETFGDDGKLIRRRTYFENGKLRCEVIPEKKISNCAE